MKFKGIVGVTGAAISLTLAAPLWVTAQEQQQLPQFEQADQNQDGYVSQDEAQQAQLDQQNFQQADQNQDSQLDRSEYEVAMQQRQEGGVMAGQQPSALMNMTADELKGMNVTTQQGDSLGDVEEVALDRQSGQASVIVSVGGFLGIGATRYAIPINELQLQEDQLIASNITNKDELRQQQTYAYQEENFQAVQGEQQLSQIAGGEQAGQQVSATFMQLDQNQDGFVSEQEAQADPQLAQNWQQADQNQDGQLDQSEFSAFEQQQEQPMQEQQQPMQEQQRGASFQQLDQDQDGYLSQQEAQMDPQLAQNWQQADQNQDGQLDQAEFSAFESQMEQQQQPGMQQEPPAGTEQQQQPSTGMEQQSPTQSQ